MTDSHDLARTLGPVLKRLYPQNPDVVIGREARAIAEAIVSAGYAVIPDEPHHFVDVGSDPTATGLCEHDEEGYEVGLTRLSEGSCPVCEKAIEQDGSFSVCPCCGVRMRVDGRTVTLVFPRPEPGTSPARPEEGGGA